MKERVKVSLATDDDGFVSQECPACRRRFKTVFGEGSDKPISCCPYCSHRGRNCWWTPEQAKYLSGVVAQQVISPKLDKAARDFNRGSSRGIWRMSVKVNRPSLPQRPVEPNLDWSILHFACCNERIKHDGKESQIKCVICGALPGIGTHEADLHAS